MTTYALWNNKGGVGKSYLSFQVACEYAFQHPEQNVLVVDACPQANASSMLLGGIKRGDDALDELSSRTPLRTISGYIEDRNRSPYVSTQTGASYAIQVSLTNPNAPGNLYLVVGDEQLEIQASRVVGAASPNVGPKDGWRIVHQWFSDLIADIKQSWTRPATVFVDCNPSFTIYTELAMSAADRLIVPFTADGSSKRAVRALLALVYGAQRNAGAQQSQFHLNSYQARMTVPGIYSYVGNRLTQNNGPANAFKTVVNEISSEMFQVWKGNVNNFVIHPNGSPPPRTMAEFRKMFLAEINDANTASVVSSALGIPLRSLVAGPIDLLGRSVTVNQTQLERLQPNISEFVAAIE